MSLAEHTPAHVQVHNSVAGTVLCHPDAVALVGSSTGDDPFEDDGMLEVDDEASKGIPSAWPVG